MHARLTAHELVFPVATTWYERLAGFRGAGARRIGLIGKRLPADVGAAELAAAIEAHDLKVSHVVHGGGPLFVLDDPATWPAAAAKISATLDLAATLGARLVYATSGPAGALRWEDAAEAFVTAARPVAERAAAVGIPLLIECTNLLSAELGFVHSLHDAIDVATAAGLDVCMDLQHCWAERALDETIDRAVDRIRLVQLSDQVPGRRERFRAVPGDGCIPFERIVGALLDAGYAGPFDLELSEEPGVDPAETLARAGAYVGALLERLGAR